MDGSATFQNSPRLATARKEGGVGVEKDSHLCLLTRCGAEVVERADNSRGELFTPTEDDRVGRLFGLTGVGTESKSWSAAHKPPTAAVQTNTAGVSGGCRMRKAFITTPTPTKVGANVYWAQVGQGGSNL